MSSYGLNKGLPRAAINRGDDADIQTLFRNLRYHGAVVADPAAARDGDLWLRSDLAPAELRARVAGAVVTVSAAGAGTGTVGWGNVTGTPTTVAGYGITDAVSSGALAAHASDSTDIHGIADTSALVLTGDARLSNARTPLAHAASHATGAADALSLASFSLLDLGTRAYSDLTGIPASFAPTAHAASHAAGGSDALSLSASQISGLALVATSGSAADLSAGTLPDARLSSNVPLKNTGNVYTALQQYERVDAANPFFSSLVAGSSYLQFQMHADGRLRWGSGVAAVDTTLYRSAAGALKTDGVLLAAGGVGVGNSTAGTVAGALVRKAQVFDAGGAALGYLYIYSS